jgi:phage repressor protein C with HTH and peptisase S24 domain
LRSRKSEPASFAIDGGELSLPGPALIELLSAVLGRGRVFRFRAAGSSMYPCIKNGDVIVVAPFPSGALPRLGQIVAFVQPGTRNLVVHRVVAKRGRSFLLKGDNMSLADGLIPAANVLGYVARVERDGQGTRIGLGFERLLIAFLSRTMSLFSLLAPMWRRVHPFGRRPVT